MIPTYLERLIHEGKAEHKTFSGAVAENLILSIPDKTYAIIYEYWYKPLLADLGAVSDPANTTINCAEFIQFVNFFNAEGFNSYWHEIQPDYVNKASGAFKLENPTSGGSFYLTATKQTEHRTCYIKTSRDISIYFTQLNADDLSLNTGAVPAIDPLNNWFGYADPLLLITRLISGYHNNATLLANYEPLQDFITKQVIPAARPDFVNQMFTIPFYGGAITSPAAYAGAGTSALGKARAQHFQCNYVLINAENPKKLI
jgi:hypothetical protein